MLIIGPNMWLCKSTRTEAGVNGLSTCKENIQLKQIYTKAKNHALPGKANTPVSHTARPPSLINGKMKILQSLGRKGPLQTHRFVTSDTRSLNDELFDDIIPVLKFTNLSHHNI